MLKRWLLLITALAALSPAACGGGPAPDAGPSLEPLAAQGRIVFNQNCATCHALSPDAIVVGPSLAGVATRAETRMPDLDAPGYLQLSILKPDAYIVDGFQPAMPADFGKKLTGEELDALVAFLMTLK